MDRLRLLQVVLWVYVAGSVVGGLMMLAGRIGNVDDVHLAATTTGKILGLGSLVALAYGAMRAALDPLRNKVVIQVLIIFTSLAALALIYRLFGEGHDHNITTWLLLLPAIAGPALMALLYPYQSRDAGRRARSDPQGARRRPNGGRQEAAGPTPISVARRRRARMQMSARANGPADPNARRKTGDPPART